MEKVQSLKTVSGFFSCYLLSSLNPKAKGRTYIGFTVNPARRIRQHNGDIMHGAYKTRKLRPWEMVLVVYGFPTKVDALQFEWAWQHPCRSKAVKEVAASIKPLTGVKGKLQILFSMLGLPSWSSMPITVNFLTTRHLALRLKCPSLPSHMCSVVAPLSELPRGSTGEEGEEEEEEAREEEEEEDELGISGEEGGRGEEEEEGERGEHRFQDPNERNWMGGREDEEVDVGGWEKGRRKRGIGKIDVPKRREKKRREEEGGTGDKGALRCILPDVVSGDGDKIDGDKIEKKGEKGGKGEKALKKVKREKGEKGEMTEIEVKTREEEKGEKTEKKVKREKGEKGGKMEIKVKTEEEEKGEKTEKKEKREKGEKGEKKEKNGKSDKGEKGEKTEKKEKREKEGKEAKRTKGEDIQGQEKGDMGGREKEAVGKLEKRGLNRKKEAGEFQREEGRPTNFKGISSDMMSGNFRHWEEENTSFFKENLSKTLPESFDDLNEMELLSVPSFNFLAPSQKEENNNFLFENSFAKKSSTSLLTSPPEKLTKNGLSFHQTPNLQPTTLNMDTKEILVEELLNWKRIVFEKENISPKKVKNHSEISFSSENVKILSSIEQSKAPVMVPPVIDLSFSPSSASPSPSPSPSFHSFPFAPSSPPPSSAPSPSTQSSPPPFPPFFSSSHPPASHFSPPPPQTSSLNDALNGTHRDTYWDDRFCNWSRPASLFRKIDRDSGTESEYATWRSDQEFERHCEPTDKATAVDVPAGNAPQASVRPTVRATAVSLSPVPDVQIMSNEELTVVRTFPIRTVLREEDKKEHMNWEKSYQEGSLQMPIGSGRFGNMPAVRIIGEEEEEEEVIEMGPGWHEALPSDCRDQQNRRCHGKGGKLREENTCNVGESREFIGIDEPRVQPPSHRPWNATSASNKQKKSFLEEKTISGVYIDNLVILSSP